MKRTYVLLISIVTILLFLVGCNSTADAIVEYNNEFLVTDLKESDDTLEMYLTEFENLFDHAPADELATYLEEKILPHSNDQIELIKSVKVDNDEVLQIHEILIQAEEKRLEVLEKQYELVKSDREDENLMMEAFELTQEYLHLVKDFEETYESLIEE